MNKEKVKPENKKLSGHGVLVPDEFYGPGKEPDWDAWYTVFFIENHIDYYAYPTQVASAEQVRFMVYTENERYYPCSERMFQSIMNRETRDYLIVKYDSVLKKVLDLIEKQIENSWERDYLKALIRIKFQHETRDGIMIPSRLEKRLLKIYLNRTQIEDPWRDDKRRKNELACLALFSPSCQSALDRVDDCLLLSNPSGLENIKKRADYLVLRRLISLSVEARAWEKGEFNQLAPEEFSRLQDRTFSGDGEAKLWAFFGAVTGSCDVDNVKLEPKKILWLASESGEIIFDLAIIRYLAGLGHKVILVLKGGPLFSKVSFTDIQNDENLVEALTDALIIRKTNLSKNEVVNVLRRDQNVVVISDGTVEELNLLLTSITFSRMFKEVDGVIVKGEDQRRRLFDTPFSFTQDIYSIATDESGVPSVWFKPRHPKVIKFTHRDLEEKAHAIITQMELAKAQGKAVMFYSGIIGSIPGKVAVAKKVMSTYVKYIKEQSAETFVINPSEHFEPGLDADDLMFMWEIVQRSGLIDIWRFQTYDDIEQAFRLMNKKVPPEWVGKDATFSTGCTKEMRIALQEQKLHPEMHIIGPVPNRFSRRDEYGIGKMYDRRLETICGPELPLA